MIEHTRLALLLALLVALIIEPKCSACIVQSVLQPVSPDTSSDQRDVQGPDLGNLLLPRLDKSVADPLFLGVKQDKLRLDFNPLRMNRTGVFTLALRPTIGTSYPISSEPLEVQDDDHC